MLKNKADSELNARKIDMEAQKKPENPRFSGFDALFAAEKPRSFDADGCVEAPIELHFRSLFAHLNDVGPGVARPRLRRDDKNNGNG